MGHTVGPSLARLLTIALAVALSAGLLLAPPTAQAAAAAGDTYDVVHAGRFGPIRFGDTLREARGKGATLRVARGNREFFEESGCGFWNVFDDDGRRVGAVMVWDVDGQRVIKRADFYRGAQPRITTASGVTFGMTEAALLRRAERRDWEIIVRRHPFGGPDEHQIFHIVRRADGHTLTYRYSTQRRNDRTVVVEILAGHRNAVRLIEGCA